MSDLHKLAVAAIRALEDRQDARAAANTKTKTPLERQRAQATLEEAADRLVELVASVTKAV